MADNGNGCRRIAWLVELEVREDALEAFRVLTAEMVACAKTEPGVDIYERHLSEDRNTVYVYERFSNNDAAQSHLEAFKARFAARFATLAERRRFVVFGRPSDALRRLLDSFGASVYCERLAGFED